MAEEAEELTVLELEALEATYSGGMMDFGGGRGGEDGDGGDESDGDDDSASTDPTRPFFVVERPNYPPSISVHLTPRGCGKGLTFVEAVLTLTAPQGYPSASAGPVAVALSAVRGLGEARTAALADALVREAEAAVGDAALGTLIEAGLDGLTALNAPEPGALCALCLDELVAGDPGGGGGTARPAGLGPGSGPPKGLLKLACYHCLHLNCAARWWAHGRGMGANPAPAAPPSEAEDADACPPDTCLSPSASLPPTALACPVCRAEAGPLAPTVTTRLDALAARVRASDGAEAAAGGEESSTATWEALLTPASASALRAFQTSCAAGLSAQRARGGLVEESYGVSLAELADRAAADAAARAEAEAAAAAAVASAAPQEPPRASKPGGGSGRGSTSNINGPGRVRGRGGGGGGGRGRGAGGRT